ncbi:hypothetical protein [Pasteurella bettyae]|uniref:Uncharacterized protein n=1 Tax=Pasteurella bettyae CCUG 2042 TaxID=1095749 RepID=I3D8P4_9PAST|nr:hypothetical protein [Pasteurella bettyae]EIJ68087.1 hypothetical protein HMPREF1052_1198 [Pasteurella bettyae CCUG 2042]SUB22571.1 Uncharacterised protein [Pasteurella bettyae]
MQYFFDKTQQTFLVKGIHPIPADAIAVSDENYLMLVDGRANGCEIIVSKDNQLSLTTPKPSLAHKWAGKTWVLDKAKQADYLVGRKSAVLTMLANKADELKSRLLVGYPQVEIESFYRQEKEALAWRADNSVETPMLTQIASVRGIEFGVLVGKVLEKSNQFAVAIGVIIGQRQKFEDALMAATTIEQVEQLTKEIAQWSI